MAILWEHFWEQLQFWATGQQFSLVCVTISEHMQSQNYFHNNKVLFAFFIVLTFVPKMLKQ